MSLNDSYWSTRYIEQSTGWDLGTFSPPLIDYCKGLAWRDKPILIPGCGNAYEARELVQLGFTDITLIDISRILVEKLSAELAYAKDKVRILHTDFFQHQAQYALILEQTFFCALEPSLRGAYTLKMSELLQPQGRLTGVLFNKEFDKAGPPFGGKEQEYRALFQPHFDIMKMETCRNSVSPRSGSELFFILGKKD